MKTVRRKGERKR